jgi:ADP-ribose pyrophosphatase
MAHPARMSDEITLFESQWLGLYRKGHWDYARRPNSDACVGILAITDQQEILLVEQFRIPVGKRVVEIPAGLVGDEPEFRGESLAETAGRELLEETGYRAGRIELLISSPTSAGMTPETTHLFHATDLIRENDGGGNASEDISVHQIHLSGLREFLSEKQSEGLLVDFKIHAALAAAGLVF